MIKAEKERYLKDIVQLKEQRSRLEIQGQDKITVNNIQIHICGLFR